MAEKKLEMQEDVKAEIEEAKQEITAAWNEALPELKKAFELFAIAGANVTAAMVETGKKLIAEIKEGIEEIKIARESQELPPPEVTPTK
jgi:F0F1-type ATP synthase membrane subunit b/b'